MATHNTKLGRPVETVEGNAADILARGNQIIELGEMLAGSAVIIQQLADNGTEMTGSSVDKLRERCGDVHAELALAGKLYSGVGPYIRDYGSALSTIQSAMRRIVPEADSRWAAYLAAQEEATQAEWRPVAFISVTGDATADEAAREAAEQDRARAVAAAAATRDAAHRLWEESASEFDAQYDTWWDEFETAASGVSSACADGIEDSFWDDLDGFVAAALDVLQVIGVVVAVLALLVGGPIVALVGAVVAVATLALTIYSFARGNSNGWDLAFAIVGVIPIGSLGAIADSGVTGAYKAWAGFGGDALSFTDDAARWGSAATDLFQGGGFRGFLSTMRSVPGAGFVDDFVGFTTGQSNAAWDEMFEGSTSVANQAWNAVDAVASHYNNQYYLPYQIYELVAGD